MIDKRSIDDIPVGEFWMPQGIEVSPNDPCFADIDSDARDMLQQTSAAVVEAALTANSGFSSFCSSRRVFSGGGL